MAEFAKMSQQQLLEATEKAVSGLTNCFVSQYLSPKKTPFCERWIVNANIDHAMCMGQKI